MAGRHPATHHEPHPTPLDVAPSFAPHDTVDPAQPAMIVSLPDAITHHAEPLRSAKPPTAQVPAPRDAATPRPTPAKSADPGPITALPGPAPAHIADPTPSPSPSRAYTLPREGRGVDGTSFTEAARKDQRILALVAFLTDDADISGAEAGRRLGVSERTGQRLLRLAEEELEARRHHADSPELADSIT
jgi:hypothetical protein